MKTNNEQKRGFTIVELLTVMAVIAILIGLLVPALDLVRRIAKDTKQKAQLHSMDVALEIYKNDFGDYPDSYDGSVPVYNGAQRLTEALVGWDLLGVHPNTKFDTTDNATLYDATDSDNLKARKGPYIKLENAGANLLSDIYDDIAASDNFSGSGLTDSFVLCDVYGRFKNLNTKKKIGAPILYFKADTSETTQDCNDAGGYGDDIYDYTDNLEIIKMEVPQKPPLGPYFGDTTDDDKEFEQMILNDEITTIKRPYRADSYILMSAGFDGEYGTSDDVFNFEK